VRPGVRITGGEFRGRGLAVPAGARPTEGRVREALFSIWGDRLEGGRLLDLFAGSGVVALEALGRGALSALAVDDNLRAVKTLEANAERLGERLLEIRRLSLPAGLSRLIEERAGPFDLVFADPPYNFSLYGELLESVAPLLAEDAEVVVEHSSRRELPLEAGPLTRVDVRRYGESGLSFYRRGPG
jgi:16S rRNA (guanine(966)-N(2))-methyltransferase RsmD